MYFVLKHPCPIAYLKLQNLKMQEHCVLKTPSILVLNTYSSQTSSVTPIIIIIELY